MNTFECGTIIYDYVKILYVLDWSYDFFNWKLYQLLVLIKRTYSYDSTTLNKISCLRLIRIKCGNNDKLHFDHLTNYHHKQVYIEHLIMHYENHKIIDGS